MTSLVPVLTLILTVAMIVITNTVISPLGYDFSRSENV